VTVDKDANDQSLGEALVESYMQRDVYSLSPKATVEDAAKFFIEHSISAAPVVDEEGRLLGVLADDDLMVEEAQLHIPTIFAALGEVAAWPPAVRRFEEESRRYLAATVEEAMTKKVVTVTPHNSIEEAATKMHDHHLRILPVVSDGKVVGVLGRRDLLRALIRR